MYQYYLKVQLFTSSSLCIYTIIMVSLFQDNLSFMQCYLLVVLKVLKLAAELLLATLSENITLSHSFFCLVTQLLPF